MDLGLRRTMNEEQLTEYREAFLLFQLLVKDPEKRKLTALNSKAKGKEPLFGSKASGPNQARQRLVELGYVRELKIERAKLYELTDKGRGRLVEINHAPATNYTQVTGEILDEYAACFRDYHDQFGAPSTMSAESSPAQVDLPTTKESFGPAEVSTAIATQTAVSKEAVVRLLDQLKQTKFHHRSYVPIHALRREVESEYGHAAASHATFDRLLKELRADRTIRMVPITDLNVPEDQLRDSIEGIGEILFYVEHL